MDEINNSMFAVFRKSTFAVCERTNSTWLQTCYFPLDQALEWNSVMPIVGESLTNQLVLDFGCGSGRDSLVLASNGAKVTGLDILENNIINAKILLANHGLVGEFITVPERAGLFYQDGYFDIINCNGVLHHIPHAEEIISEFYRVLRPGGVIYIMLYTEDLFSYHLNTIIDMLRNDPNRTWQSCFGEVTDKCKYSTYYSLSDGIILMKSKGFIYLDSKIYHDNYFRIFKFGKPMEN